MNSQLLQIEQLLKQQNYPQALNAYADFVIQFPEYLIHNSRRTSANRQHAINAANLSRRALYESVYSLRQASPRVSDAIDGFNGVKSLSKSGLQKPSFFYIPDIKAKPFYEPSDIAGLPDLLSQLKSFVEPLRLLVGQEGEHYVSHFENIPDTEEWKKLQEGSWRSIHFLPQLDDVVKTQPFSADFVNLFSSQVVADCKPHAPEAFLSRLAPGAYIPPHVGLSNVKLTVQIPICVNHHAWLKAGDETRTWSDVDVMVFDDSMVHSAANEGTDHRMVLIFDIWHPDLTNEERHAVRQFMHLHNVWHGKYGHLAYLDKGLV